MRDRLRAGKANRGFTLLEVMISLAVVGGLMVTLIYTLTYHLGLAEKNMTVTVSAGLAKEKLHSMVKNPAAGSGNFPEPHADFSYETEVRDSIFPGMAEVIVTVRKEREEVRMSELIRKRQ